MSGWRDYLWITWWRSLWDGGGPRGRSPSAAAAARTPKERLQQRLLDDYARDVPGADGVVRTLRHWIDALGGHLDLSRCERAAVRQLPKELIDDCIAYVTQRSRHEQLRITLPDGLNQQVGWWSDYRLG
ncbi:MULTISPECIES: hypothetical protein [unclassified Rhizobacter]|uniref:hypothetical protein n=1 Tax=unclassified Rhizobacter TaxID=2640088 RepID=UPI0006F31C42|nr:MULTISPECIES: hypothetical protein [unclassified Rhizobacter]KQU76917.1 hypothetical protein ASC88_03075 [Rhizobacter sp. Root29]KQV97438.1 hypothetical protein ASC98_12605 [Rhizobacter sp. Root1238]KRB10109.1 hypothetical protein ASE08_11240 [Rhizobacter sp. Root16D2]